MILDGNGLFEENKRNERVAILCFNQQQNHWSSLQVAKPNISIYDTFFGHPIYQFLSKPDFFNFTLN